MRNVLFIIIIDISIIIFTIFISWLSEEISQRKIIQNLYQFCQPLTFTFKGVEFTVSKRELYSDFNAYITEVIINNEPVLKAYELDKLWTKHKYIWYSTDRSTMEVQEILKQASKVYIKNLNKEFEAKWQSQSYFKEENK